MAHATHPTSTQTGNQLLALCASAPARASNPLSFSSLPPLDAGVVALDAAADATGDIDTVRCDRAHGEEGRHDEGCAGHAGSEAEAWLRWQAFKEVHCT